MANRRLSAIETELLRQELKPRKIFCRLNLANVKEENEQAGLAKRYYLWRAMATDYAINILSCFVNCVSHCLNLTNDNHK